MRCVMKLIFSNIVRISLAIAAIGMGDVYSAEIDPEQRCCCAPGSRQAAQNSAYQNSPRGREEFPWLARAQSRKAAQTPKPSFTEKNRALANSPRFHEEHPELLRGGGKPAVEIAHSVPVEVRKNVALASSPRAREEFPALRVTGRVNSEKVVWVCACAVR